MIICETIQQTRKHLQPWRNKSLIGLVPTMGALHEGHLSLIEQCKRECGRTVVSIFVNPTQFGPQEDLKNYPRPFEQDCELCRQAGVDLIFAPPAEQMYPREQLTWVGLEKLTEHLCGASRKGHFQGVCTVVGKLFNIIQPDRAYFGQKDAQQLAVLKRMVSDLNFPVEICSCPTVRDEKGLAISSRNQYLSPQQREIGQCLNRALNHANQQIQQGVVDVQSIEKEMCSMIESQPQTKIDYISIVDQELLQPMDRIDRPCLIALSVWVGPARLIDNINVTPPECNS